MHKVTATYMAQIDKRYFNVESNSDKGYFRK